MNVYDEVLYPKYLAVDAEITKLFTQWEAVIDDKTADIKDKQARGVALHSRTLRVQKELKHLSVDGPNVGPTTRALKQACKARLAALIFRMLETLFSIDEEHFDLEEELSRFENGSDIEEDERVTVLTVRGNNLFHGKLVTSGTKDVTILMHGRERFIPADNIEYVEKAEKAQQ